MLASEWASFTDPEPMLEFLSATASARKLRLFACACCRAVWQRVNNPHCRAALEVAERFADGQATVEELKAAGGLADRQIGFSRNANCAAARAATANAHDAAVSCADLAALVLAHFAVQPAIANAWAAVRAGAADADRTAAWERYDTAANTAFTAERCRQADLLRELFPEPPGEPATVAEWPGAVLQLANSLYAGADCAFALRDALLEAGHPELAEHFGATNHPRGCWALDRILGRV